MRPFKSESVLFAALPLSLSLLAACGASADDSTGESSQDIGAEHTRKDAGAKDSGEPATDASSSSSDGTPERLACTSTFGSALTGSFGRLDGYLRSIVVPSHGACNADGDHVHLQVEANGGTYDVAVNIDSSNGSPDVSFLEVGAPLVGGDWSEGWHAGGKLDYVASLGVHSGSFTAVAPSSLSTEVIDKLASVNHVSVFATAYGPGGAHLVHRSDTAGSGQDGALVIEPLSGAPQYLLFHFAEQTF